MSTLNLGTPPDNLENFYKALPAFEWLDQNDCKVLSVDLRGEHPTITIDGNGCEAIEGFPSVTQPATKAGRVVRFTRTIQGCRIQWECNQSHYQLKNLFLQEPLQ